MDMCSTASPSYTIDPSTRLHDLAVSLGGPIISSNYSAHDYDGTLDLDQFLTRVDDVLVLAQKHGSMRLSVAAAAATIAQLDGVLDKVHEFATANEYVPEPTKALISNWWMGAMGPKREQDYIEAPRWADAAINYPPPVSRAVDDLLSQLRAKRQAVHVWYGPPGTGKTSAVRILAKELSEDVDIHIVMDPEQLLNGGIDYMMTIMSKCKQSDKSYVLILEDSGQLVTLNAGNQGAALGRILNITDGIIGQNANVSVLITTNEPVGELHPALMRPGRCGSQIDFRPFTREEARGWCEARGVDPARVTEKETSLAGLYALADESMAPVRSISAKRKFGFGVEIEDDPPLRFNGLDREGLSPAARQFVEDAERSIARGESHESEPGLGEYLAGLPDEEDEDEVQ
jgi:hypothetical protein